VNEKTFEQEKKSRPEQREGHIISCPVRVSSLTFHSILLASTESTLHEANGISEAEDVRSRSRRVGSVKGVWGIFPNGLFHPILMRLLAKVLAGAEAC